MSASNVDDFGERAPLLEIGEEIASARLPLHQHHRCRGNVDRGAGIMRATGARADEFR